MIMRYRFFAFLSSIFCICSSLAQSDDAWQTIFNGKNFDGWSIIGGAGKVTIEDGAFELHQTANTKEHTFVKTNKKYKNFILEVDCKRDKLSYGILFRTIHAPDTAHVRLYGYQVKIVGPPRRWTGAIFDDFGNTWDWMTTLEDDPRAQYANKDQGEWDHYRIEVINNHIKVWLNGIPTTNMINNKYKKGYIAFKIHFLGDNPEREEYAAWVKNIRIITSNPEKYSKPIDIPVKVVQ